VKTSQITSCNIKIALGEASQITLCDIRYHQMKHLKTLYATSGDTNWNISKTLHPHDGEGATGGAVTGGAPARSGGMGSPALQRVPKRARGDRSRGREAAPATATTFDLELGLGEGTIGEA
jgi:hypothetical protein